jgi:hypothetical protein
VHSAVRVIVAIEPRMYREALALDRAEEELVSETASQEGAVTPGSGTGGLDEGLR